MNIIEYRKSQKMTQIDVAVKIGISQKQYCNIEKNPTQTRVETFMKLVEVLEISDEDIIKIIRNRTE